MSIYETYSQRKRKAERTGQADVYQYDELPERFRHQVIHILSDAIGTDIDRVLRQNPNPYWRFVHSTLAREFGIPQLRGPSSSPSERVKTHLLTATVEEALDIIELSFRVISTSVDWSSSHIHDYSIRQKSDDAIEELNARFKENDIGYQFEAGEIIRVDSQYLHAETVKPTIALLNAPGFEGAIDEFMAAHEYYRHGDHKEAISNANKAFESVLKVICAQRGWTPPANPQARQLIETVIANGLISPEMQSYFNGLRPVLESGLPTLRNRTSGHGQGKVPVVIPGHLAAYALHMAAANIVMLVEAHKALP